MNKKQVVVTTKQQEAQLHNLNKGRLVSMQKQIVSMLQKDVRLTSVQRMDLNCIEQYLRSVIGYWDKGRS